MKKALSLALALCLLLSTLCVTAGAAKVDEMTDIVSGEWYYDAVSYCLTRGLMKGTGGGKFTPDGTVQVAQMAQVLFNKSGASSSGDGDAWYSNAMAWCEANGVFENIGPDSLDPEGEIAREKICVMAYNFYKGFLGKTPELAGEDDMAKYSDWSEVSDWAKDAVRWSMKVEFMRGTSDTTLSPSGTVSRSQLAQFLKNLDDVLGEADNQSYIEAALNLANNPEQEWTYSSDAWTLSVVSAVAFPELPNNQGVSVCVPAAFVTGIDTDGDGTADVTAADASGAVKGSLVIDYNAKVTSTNGQTYTAATAPVVLNTGAAGYGSQTNQRANASYAKEGYINVACGNRGKQSTATDADGNTYYTGDAPSCLVDQKAAARFVKYNILLGNLPGNVDYLVTTGGSGGGAHAAMFAASSNNPDFYDYQIEAGAVGVYKNADGSYSTTVTIDGKDYEISDGAWGCIAYSAITSLYEADMALAFEYYLDTDYSFKTKFQKQLAEYLSESYMKYINDQKLSVKESDVGFDLDGDGKLDSTVALSIEHDMAKYPDTNGYGGTYLDLYLAEFTQNLQWYLDNLDYSDGWTWFDESGKALSDSAVAAMTSADKAQAFIEGRYTKSSSGMGGPGGPGGMPPDGMMPGDMPPDGMMPGDMPPDGMPGGPGDMPPDGMPGGMPPDGMPGGPGGPVGTPDGDTTQSSTGTGDSRNYSSFEEMTAAYKSDIEEVNAGDKYGKNIVSLYNPLNYIGAAGTENPAWTRVVMGAAEGDISMFCSLNMQIAWLNAGTDAVIEWQWDGGHVPNETLGDSFALCLDQMYGEYVKGAAKITKPSAEKQSTNGDSEEASGKNISSWVDSSDISSVSFSLSDIAAYRTAGAAKAMPGFDVIDYGQEDYVFGNTEKDARHWNSFVLEIFEKHADTLAPLFNK